MTKRNEIKQVMTYKGYRIFFDTEYRVFFTALNRDGTDTYFSTLDKVFEAIEHKTGE